MDNKRTIEENQLRIICKFREFRYKEDSHAFLEPICLMEAESYYGEAPLCKFQCCEEG